MNPYISTTHFNSEKSEQVIIAALLYGKKQAEVLSELDKPDYFWNDKYRKIFEVMLELKQKDSNIDILSVFEKLKKKHRFSELAEIMIGDSDIWIDVVLNHDTVLQACNMIKEHWVKRNVYLNIREGKDLKETLQEITSITRDKGRFFTPKQLADFYFSFFHDKQSQKTIIFPFKILNYATMGMRESQYIIVAARPSVGKSSILENIAFHASENGHKTLFATAEMSVESLTTRIISRLSGIDLFRRKPVTEEEQAGFNNAVDRLSRSKLHLYDRGAMKTMELEKQLRTEKFDLVCVDYLSLIEPLQKYRSLYEKVSFASQELKGLAVKYRVAFLVASQYNRMAEGRQPNLAHLRESGGIEQDADIVISLWSKSEDKNEDVAKIYIDLLKNRNGFCFGNSDVKEYFLWFNKKKTEFSEPVQMEKEEGI